MVWSELQRRLSVYVSNDLYQATCAHEQKTHGLQWARSMGVATMANKYVLFVMLMGPAEQFEAHLSYFLANFDLFVALSIFSEA